MRNTVNRWRRKLFFGFMTLPVSGWAAIMSPTPSTTEGPFYPVAGMRFGDIDNDLVKLTSKVEQAGGEIVLLTGRVLDQAGNPVTGARVEIWQCDVNGRYLHHGDSGQTERDPAFQGFGHDLSGADGSYSYRYGWTARYRADRPAIRLDQDRCL